MSNTLKFDPKVGDLVYFRWEDHCSYRDAMWRPIHDIVRGGLTGSYCETAGFVVDVSRTHITTCANMTVNDDDMGEDGSQTATRLRKTISHGKVIKRFK